MSKRILIVGAGENQLRIIRKAVEMGLIVHAIDANPSAPGLPLATEGHVSDICDPQQLRAVAEAARVDGIYPGAEVAVEAVANVTSGMGLPGIAPEVALRARDKFQMREALRRNGMPGPDYKQAASAAEALSAAVEIGFPVIVKPVDGNSSRGVSRVAIESEIDEAFANAREESRGDAVLVEGFLDGDEYCVDGLMSDGTFIPGGVTAKELSPLPHRFDQAIFMPPPDEHLCHTVQTCAEDSLKAIGFDSGTTHVEIIVTGDGPRIVEIAGRPGGGRIPTDLIPLAYGMDFIADSIRIALGERPRETRRFARGAALIWIPAAPGVVHEIFGIEEAEHAPGVVEICVNTVPNETLLPIVDCVSRDRTGYVLAVGSSGRDALERARAARDLCKIVTLPAELINDR